MLMSLITVNPYPGESRQKLTVLKYLAFVCLCIAIYLVQILSGNHALGFSHWIVQDGINLLNGLNSVLPGCPESCLGRGSGTYLVHGLPFTLMGITGFFVMNMLIVLWIVARHGMSLLFIFPFYLFSLALPSKDLLLLLLILEWGRSLQRGYWVSAIMLIILMYFFRDGNMFSSIACTVAVLLWRIRIPWQGVVLSAIGFCGFMFVYGAPLLMHIPIYASYVGVYKRLSWIEASSFQDYLIRLVGNASNIAMRTLFIDDQGGISLLAIVGVVSGIAMLTAFCLAAWSFVKNDKRDKVVFASLLLFVAWAVLSVNPLVHPRYLMPYLVAFFMLVQGEYSAREKHSALAVSLGMTIIGMILYTVLPIPRPPVPIVHQYMLY